MLRLVGLWTEPDDIDAFERDYLGSHFPELDSLPGNKGTRTSRCIDGPRFRMTEVSFSRIDDIHAALETEGGKRLMAAARELAEKYGIASRSSSWRNPADLTPAAGADRLQSGHRRS